MIIKAYNQEGVFISKGTTNKEGLINLECPQMPSNIKYIMNNSVVNTQNISNLKAENGVISIIAPLFAYIPKSGILQVWLKTKEVKNLYKA